MNVPQVLPSKFSELVDLIVQADKNGKLQNAYGLVGPEGLGKGWIALTIARMLLTADTELHPDLVTLEVTRDTSIDDVREFTHSFHSTPFVAKRKVGLIFHIDSLSPASQNTLLKTLEEPPPQSVIFATLSSKKSVLPTIQSRLVKISVPTVPREEIERFRTENALPGADESSYTFSLGRPAAFTSLLKQEKKEMVHEAQSAVRAISKNPSAIFVVTRSLEKKERADLEEFLQFFLLALRTSFSLESDQRNLLIQLSKTCSKILASRTNENPLRLLESTCASYIR